MHVWKGKEKKDGSFCRGDLVQAPFHFIGNYHPPQAENPASRILFYTIGNSLSKRTVLVYSKCGKFYIPNDKLEGYGGSMDCKETRKNIYKFIEDELEGKELQNFIKHVTQCSECMDELAIQYLVTEGMQHLETENAFDLQNRLEKKMESAKKKIRARKRVIVFMYIMETLAILAVLLMTVLVIIK